MSQVLTATSAGISTVTSRRQASFISPGCGTWALSSAGALVSAIAADSAVAAFSVPSRLSFSVLTELKGGVLLSLFVGGPKPNDLGGLGVFFPRVTCKRR